MQSLDTSWNNILNDSYKKPLPCFNQIRAKKAKNFYSNSSHGMHTGGSSPLKRRKKEWSAWNSICMGSGGTSSAACPRLLKSCSHIPSYFWLSLKLYFNTTMPDPKQHVMLHHTVPCQQQCQTPCSMLCYTTQFLANNNVHTLFLLFPQISTQLSRSQGWTNKSEAEWKPLQIHSTHFRRSGWTSQS